MAHLNGSDPHSRKYLFTGPFADRWTDDSLGIFSMFSADPDCRPLVLLPNDIQLEDYAPRYEVRFGFDASRTLARLMHREHPYDPDLVLIDFAPALFPDHDALLPTLNDCLLGDWPRRLTLVVLSPSTSGLRTSGFDAQLRFPS